MWMYVRAALLLARVLAAADERAGEAGGPGRTGRCRRRLVGLDVLERRRDADLDLALLDEERGRAELALAADDLALLEVPADDRPFVPLAGTACETPSKSGMLGAVPSAVDRAGAGAGSLAQGSASTIVRLVRAPVGHEIMHSPQETHDDSPIGSSRSKAIVRRVALAHPADDLVVADVVAAADAAVAEDAGVVVDGDDDRRVVVAAVAAADLGKRDECGFRPKLLAIGSQLVVAVLLVGLARRRVVGQQQLGQHLDGVADLCRSVWPRS